MSKQYPGGLITKSPVTPSGPYETSTASGIWTLDQQAAYAKLGQWPTAGNPAPDAQFNYVTMLLHGDGTNGAQNNTFLDSSTNNFTITRNGNTTQGSFSPYGSNWANYLNNESANNSYLSVASNAAFAYGTSDFTVECWVFMTATPANDNGIIEQRPASTNGNYFLLGVSSSNQLFVYVNSAYRIGPSAGTVMTVNAWNHVAYSRSSGTATLYLNGVSIGSWSDSINYGNQPVGIGFQAFASLGLKYFAGYISNVRIVKGTAVYTAGFTPSTTPLTAITNTSLLTCQSNRFIDNSTNAFAITVNGTPSVQRFNPFGTSTAYSTSVIGGSGYFDGSGDYLTAPSNSAFAMGTGDFTIECWINTPLVNANNDVIIELRSSGSTSTGFVFNMNPTGVGYQLNFYTDGGFNLGSTVLNYNVWNHCAVTRSGTTVRLFSNGVVSATFTKANNFSDTPTPHIGVSPLYSPSNLLGYMADLRVVKGTALYTSAFTPPTAPLTAVSGTSLLANMTNGAIFDNAMMNDLETVGNAQISTSVKKYGTGSLAFDGSGDYLLSNVATPDLYAFGTGNFTIEGWYYFNSVTTEQELFDFRPASTQGTYPMAYVWTDSKLYYWVSSANQITSSTTLSAGIWYHIAICRSGTSTKMFIDGTQSGSTYTDSNNYLVGSNRPAFGFNAFNLSVFYNGYIDDLRITKGYARYTTTFTPPTAAFPNIGPT